MNIINLPQNFTLRSNRSCKSTKKGGKGRRERRGGGDMGGYKRDGEGKGVERRHRGD